jgi:hypothetical protein
MYIKNVGELFKEQIPIKLKLFQGNTIYGKIISLEDGKGAIKLYDGTILPAIFINDNSCRLYSCEQSLFFFVIQHLLQENLNLFFNLIAI